MWLSFWCLLTTLMPHQSPFILYLTPQQINSKLPLVPREVWDFTTQNSTIKTSNHSPFVTLSSHFLTYVGASLISQKAYYVGNTFFPIEMIGKSFSWCLCGIVSFHIWAKFGGHSTSSGWPQHLPNHSSEFSHFSISFHAFLFKIILIISFYTDFTTHSYRFQLKILG